ncbi:MAG: histidine phosphatase family protein [Ectothiorhodospiraceae bacterium]|nr:histidine phosphatase family protein [Ectothiorhodospiraceae bacterium]
MTSNRSSNNQTPQTIWIARHGHRYDFQYPDWFETAPRRYDPPLSEQGLQQAQELAQRLEREYDQGSSRLTIVSSPFRRCVTTANAVAERLGTGIYLEWGIGEWLNPDWMTEMPEIASPEELQAEFPRLDLSYRSRSQPQYPEVSQEDCWRRSGETARELARQTSGDLLLLGHGATVLGMTQGLLGHPVDMETACCCLVKLTRYDGDWCLELKGDTSHLSETESQIRLN